MATPHRDVRDIGRPGSVRRHYGTGVRLRQLAESVLLNDGFHGARRSVLRALVEEVGESCNITALAGGEVIYLDRVETAAPLRFYLHPGSRVPVHCSASGKMFLAQMAPAQRRRLLIHASLTRYTPRTLVDSKAIEEDLKRIRQEGHALDDEEFLPGLVCLAVPVPAAGRARSSLCVAVQAPAIRLDAQKILQLLPALRRAADALAAVQENSPARQRRSNG